MVDAPATGGTVKIPGLGAQKKQTVYMVGGLVVVVVAVALYRGRHASATDTTVPTSEINPATGFPYGSPEDAAATAANSAYQNPTDYGGGGGPAQTPPPAAGFTSNAQWTQAATAYLVETAEYNGATVSAALGKYITGAGVVAGSTEDSIIQQAIAAEGLPPQGGASGFPPSIRHTTTPGEPKPPTPAPKPTPKATALPAPHLRVSVVSKRRHQARLTWNGVAGADHYVVYHHNAPYQSSKDLKALVKDNGNYYIRAVAGSKAHTDSKLSNPVRVNGL